MPINFHRLSTCCLFGLAMIACCGVAFAGKQQFNLSNDFSLTQNPNGPWSYNQSGSPITAPLSGLDTLQGWGYYSTYDASVSKAMLPPAASWWFDAAMGDIILHVASANYLGPIYINWVAPRDGYITITGRAWEAYFAPDRDANWTLRINGQDLAHGETIKGVRRIHADADFANNILPGQSLTNVLVQKGDILTFTTYNLSWYGHFMGVRMRIDLADAPAAPCPADITADHVVNVNDLLAVINSWGPCNECPADVSYDSNVNVNDLLAVINNWGPCP